MVFLIIEMFHRKSLFPVNVMVWQWGETISSTLIQLRLYFAMLVASDFSELKFFIFREDSLFLILIVKIAYGNLFSLKFFVEILFVFSLNLIDMLRIFTNINNWHPLTKNTRCLSRTFMIRLQIQPYMGFLMKIRGLLGLTNYKYSFKPMKNICVLGSYLLL